MDINAFNRMLLQSVLLLLLLTYYQTIAYRDDTHNVAKRLDSEVCSEDFNIHSSTIIRTEESKAMGARFINDEEVASSDACMKLCCSTNDCDVFVFEEKSIGTCFLFHCGMPDDFRCKFTAHTNYSSGILTVSRNELQSSLNSQASKPKLSQNELDLANLKRPYHIPSSSSLSSEVTTSTIPPLGVRLADITSTQASIKSSTSCGRFQFQCQKSKECIAIYNVCDQIAQCEDGSDEGPECPAATPTPVKSILNGIENQPKLDNQINRINSSPLNINDNYNNQMPRAMIHNREDPMSAPKYPQTHVGQYMETDDSRIFTHKNGLLSSSNVNNYPALQYQTQQQAGKYPYMIPQQPQQQQQSIDEQIYQQRNEWPQMPQQQQQLQPPQVVIQQIPNVVKQQSNSVWPEKLPKQIDEKIAGHKKEQQKELEYSEEYGEGEENQAESNTVTTTEVPKKKQRKHKKIKNKEKSHEKPLNEQLKQLKNEANEDAKFIREHGSHGEKPTGAILSLTIGCLILAALSILIGCRMRRVPVRRRRHGGKAVDADFLVNGMYL